MPRWTDLPDESALCPYLAPEPSRALAAFIIGLHMVSGLAAWLNPLPVGLRLVLSVAVLLSFWFCLRVWRSPPIVGLRQRPDGGWLLYLAGDVELEALLLGGSLANTWFVLLHFQGDRFRLNLLVCRDSLPADGFRNLRVTLHTRAGIAEKHLLNL